MAEDNFYQNVQFSTVSTRAQQQGNPGPSTAQEVQKTKVSTRVQQQGAPGTSAAKEVKKTKEPAARPLLLKVVIAILVFGLLVVIIMLAFQLSVEEKVQAEQAAENQKTGNNFLALEESIKNESQISQDKMQEMLKNMVDNLQSINQESQISQDKIQEMLKNMSDNLQSINQDTQEEFQEIKSAVKENHKESLDKLKMLEELLNPPSCDKVKQWTAKIWNGTGGVFDIYPPGLNGKSLEVYCDTTTDGGGWLVFQRRMDGSVDFYRNWTDYVTGFGNKEGEFWLGLETLHKLTSHGNYELRVDLEDRLNNTLYAKYSSFNISDATSKYQLNIGSYSGTAGDRLSYHNGQNFSTNDQDNDARGSNCAQTLKGAWWYKTCHHYHHYPYSNLNGKYARFRHFIGFSWGSREPLKFSEMKIRPQ